MPSVEMKSLSRTKLSSNCNGMEAKWKGTDDLQETQHFQIEINIFGWILKMDKKGKPYSLANDKTNGLLPCLQHQPALV